VRETGIIIKNWTDSIRTMVSFQAPDGWRVEPYETHTVIGEKYGETHVPLRIFPPENATSGKLIIRAGTPLRRSETIDYDHIPAQIYLSTGGIDLVRAPLKIIPLHIGYIMGSGDDIPSDLRQVGYTVTELSDMDIEQEELDNFDVLIAGTRAYNTRAKLHLFKDKLMRYIENGGTYIVLHNTRFGLQPDDIGPYPFTVGRDRVSVEDAPVAILHPGHRLLSFPNRITPSDFDGWVQERGLYFASEWDPRYQTIISSHDPGESPLEGGILYTPFGKGHYIYAAYSWFRQLPAGIPGAYKLFINLITVGADNEQ
jgi:hypothetical protein